jgi:hypothetical protein
MAYEHSTAATDNPRSATRASFPEMWVNASTKPGCHDITSKHQFGQIDLRHHLLHPVAQINQRRRVRHRDQGGDVQFAVFDKSGRLGVS